jgi:uncharacterized membrane protein YeaQ/YmgE (transglycosylase-associated protein family)
MGLDQTQTIIALLSGISFGLVTGIIMGGWSYIVRNMVAGVVGAYIGLWWLPRYVEAMPVNDPFWAFATLAGIYSTLAIGALKLTDL